MNDRENWLRTVEFRNPEWIPCSMSLAPLAWHTHRGDLEALVLRHPRLFPGFKAGSVDYDNFGPVYRQGEYFRDSWGCLWYNTIGGLEGQVVEHPLADWSALKNYTPPDPLVLEERGPRDMARIAERVAQSKRDGYLAGVNGERLFDRLYFLRGFEALMMDFATDDPHLPLLIEMLHDYEVRLLEPQLALEPDVVGFHTDIGMQGALMISPAKFRKYIKPLFMDLFQRCRKAGAHVALSSDGRLVDIVDDLVECGVSTHDPQFRANTLDGIVRAYKGKLCAIVDLDRQLSAFCEPEDLREQVRETVEKMADPKGGLMISGSIWDGVTPIENIEALCSALEEFCLPPV